MRSIEGMAFELIAREVSRVGVSSVDPEKINQAWAIAKDFQQRIREANQGVPTAILEAERLKCNHIWRDAAADGPARNCLNCGQTEVEEG